MNIHFSPGAQKREQTPVDNLFLSEFLPDADGEAVKVYLYGLMQCHYSSMGDIAISEALHLNEGAIRAAFVYWQSKGLVRILKNEPLEVEYLTVEQPAVTTAVPLKYQAFVRTLKDLVQPRELTLSELRHVYDYLEVYHLEEKAVLELVSYCIERKTIDVPIQYVTTVAKDWADNGIRTYEQARKRIEKDRVLWHGATAITDQWNRFALPTKDEIDLYDKWVYQWGFEEAAILSVCSQMTDSSKPTFKKLNDRLEELYEKNKVNAADVQAYAAEKEAETKFAREVFNRMGKVSWPTVENMRQLSVFLEGPEGLSREVVLLAAEECVDAASPFGKLKSILKRLSEQKIKTVEEAQKSLAEWKAAYVQKDDRRRSRKRNTLLNYAEQGVSHANLDDIAMDLDEL